LALLVLLAVFGGGFMFLRARQAQQMALMERDRAMQAEMQARTMSETKARMMLAEVQLQKLRQKEHWENLTKEQWKQLTKYKSDLLKEYPETVEFSYELLLWLAQSNDPNVAESYQGQHVVFIGRTSLDVDNPDLRVSGFRIAVQFEGASDRRHPDVGPAAVVMGKIISIDRDAKVITIEAKLENWRYCEPEPPVDSKPK
jgi:hypothetical protein